MIGSRNLLLVVGLALGRQLTELCSQLLVGVVHLKMREPQKPPRRSQDYCEIDRCHFTPDEHTACRYKTLAMDLLQDKGSNYDSAVASKIKELYMSKGEISPGKYSFGGVNINVTHLNKLETFLIALSPKGSDKKDSSLVESSDALNSTIQRSTEALDLEPKPLPKGYLSLTVPANTDWLELKGVLEKIHVDHIIYQLQDIPECGDDSKDVLCNLKSSDQDFMVNLQSYTSKEPFNYHAFEDKLGLHKNPRFHSFIGVPQKVGLKVEDSVPASTQCKDPEPTTPI